MQVITIKSIQQDVAKSNAQQLVRSYIGTGAMREAIVEGLRVRARAAGVLTGERKELNAWLRPLIAEAYGLPEDEAFTRTGSAAARQCLSRLGRDILGPSANRTERQAKPQRVSRELAATMAQLVERFGAEMVKAAIKRSV